MSSSEVEDTERSSFRPGGIPIAKSAVSSDEAVPLLDAAGVSEDWSVEKIAPGQELSDYIPLNNSESSEPIPTSADGTSTAINPVPPLTYNSPKSDQDRDDEPDPVAELGVCGLRNIGNTCYMNASLQCLRSVSSLMSYCLSSGPTQPSKEKEDGEENDATSLDKGVACRSHIHATFTSLVKKLWSGQFSNVRPQIFKTTLGLLHPQFSGSRQHDSQEFLAMLFSTLHEHCSSGNSSVFTDIFQGDLRNEVVCTECSKMSVKTEPFIFLSLPLPGAYDRIVELYYVNAECPPTVTRLAGKVCRYGSVVKDVKSAVRSLLGRDIPSELLVLTEVLDGTVIRTLADSLPLERLSSKRGEKLYMFEMTPAQDLMASQQTATGAETTSNDASASAETAMETDAPTEIPAETAVVMMEWHSCNICLEEMIDSELLTHAQCGGTLCSNCLQASKAHQESLEQKRITCPICSKPLSEESDFKPMTGEGGGTSSGSDTISLLLMTVLCRNSERLVGHPLLKHLPVQSQGDMLYKEIAKCLPPKLASLPFSIKLTGDKGRSCSRCVFTTKCSGCVVSQDQSCDLKPGDHLTVEFSSPLSPELLSEIEVVVEHPSVSLLETRQLTLNDCLSSFAQRETLSQENSWFCPNCEAQRLAEHTLSVDKVPQTLIVHLKRFIYHGREGSKVEGSVSFPMELSGVSNNDSSPLELAACICHTGTLHFGHYTAYCKHPCTGEWVYYNDSTTTKVDKPDCEDSVYMLFYQKPTGAPNVEVAKEKFDDSAERVTTEKLLRLFKPPVSMGPLPAPLPLKRSSSNPDLTKPEDAIPAVKLLRDTAACPW